MKLLTIYNSSVKSVINVSMLPLDRMMIDNCQMPGIEFGGNQNNIISQNLKVLILKMLRACVGAV